MTFLRSTATPSRSRNPTLPILLGGNAKNVLQRVARWGDGWLPSGATVSQIEESRKILDTLAAENGRDPASLSISVFGGHPPDDNKQQVDDFLNAGALRVCAWAPHCESEEQMGDELERMAEAMIR